MRSITGWIGKHNTSAYRISTPNATLGIRGTDHEAAVIDKAGGDEPGTYDTVYEGATFLKNPQGETEVTPGKFAFVPRNRSVAPYILAKQPGFWARRKLRIESRIQQRKEFFRNRLEQMRDDRIKHPNSIRGKQSGSAEGQRARHPGKELQAAKHQQRKHRHAEVRQPRRAQPEQRRHKARSKSEHTRQ